MTEKTCWKIRKERKDKKRKTIREKEINKDSKQDSQRERTCWNARKRKERLKIQYE